MEKVYIVTEGCYSDYHIEAVFESREKAEAYCECHDDCEIEEHDLSDDKIYTVFDAVYASGYIGQEPSYVKFYHRCYEDDISHSSNFKKVDVHFDGSISLRINRIIPNDISHIHASNLIRKIWNDYAAIIAYETSELSISPNTDYGSMIAIQNNLNDLLGESHVSSEDEL